MKFLLLFLTCEHIFIIEHLERDIFKTIVDASTNVIIKDFILIFLILH